jgi:hypothetical protein
MLLTKREALEQVLGPIPLVRAEEIFLATPYLHQA